jgi:hypothetical protein
LHPLADRVRTVVGLLAQGWNDLADADGQREDPLLRLAGSSARGLTPLDEALPSQPTLSRLIGTLAMADNRERLHEALMHFAGQRLRAFHRGHRRRELTLDVDGMPIAVAGHQAGSAYNGHYGERVYAPLVASIGETGDLVGTRLRQGRAHPAAEAPGWIPELVDQAKRHLCQVGLVRMDAGLTGDTTLSALEHRRVPYLGREALECRAAATGRTPSQAPARAPAERAARVGDRAKLSGRIWPPPSVAR